MLIRKGTRVIKKTTNLSPRVDCRKDHIHPTKFIYASSESSKGSRTTRRKIFSSFVFQNLIKKKKKFPADVTNLVRAAESSTHLNYGRVLVLCRCANGPPHEALSVHLSVGGSLYRVFLWTINQMIWLDKIVDLSWVCIWKRETDFIKRLQFIFFLWIHSKKNECSVVSSFCEHLKLDNIGGLS